MVLTVVFLATVDLKDVADAGTDGTETSLVLSVETEIGGYLSTKGRFLSFSG